MQYTRIGLPEASPKWQTLLEELERIQPKLVILDTLNSSLHGDESNASVIQDWFRVVVGKICGDIGTTVFITHHIRKEGNVYSLDDMRAAVRGSTAIINSVRAAIGFWKPKNYVKRLESMNDESSNGKLYLFGVLKENNPEMLRGTKTLLRGSNGVLDDVTDRDVIANSKLCDPVKEAWLIFAIATGAKQGTNQYHRWVVCA